MGVLVARRGFLGYAVVAALCCVFSVSGAEDNAEAAVTLTGSTFDAFWKENPAFLVKFYTSWCRHCQNLAPAYEAAAKTLRARKEGPIPLVKVDVGTKQEEGTKNDLGARFGINAYPTLKFFKGDRVIDVDCGRTAPDIVDYVLSMIGDAVTIVDSMAEAEKLASEQLDKATAVGIFTDKNASQFAVFAEAADRGRTLAKFVAVLKPDADSTVRVYRSEEQGTVSHPVTDPDQVVQVIKRERLPWFGKITPANYAHYTDVWPALVWFAGSKADYERVAKEISEAAKKVRSRYGFIWIDADEYRRHVEQSLGVQDPPALILLKEEDRFVFPAKDGFSSADAIVRFIDDVDAGKIERTLMSEPVPEEDEGPVKKIVGLNFREKVFQKDKDVFVEIYASWCQHCKNLQPIYEEFATKVESIDHVVVAKMDGGLNQIPEKDWKVDGFPTIFFVRAGEKVPIKYSGSRTVSEFQKFLAEHSSKKVEFETHTEEPASKEEL